MQTVYSPPPKSIVHKVISLTPKAEKILLRPPRLMGRRTSANSSWITKELTQRRSSEVIVPTTTTKTACSEDASNSSSSHLRKDDETNLKTPKKVRLKKTEPRRRHSSFVPTKTSSSSSPTKTKKAVVVTNSGVDKDETRDNGDMMKIKKKLERKTSTSSSTTTSTSKPPRRRRSSKRNSSASSSSITQHSSFSTQATQRTISTAPTTTTGGGSFSIPAANNNADTEASISAPERFWSSSSFNNSFDMSLSFEFPDMEFEYDGELNDVVAKSNHGSRTSIDNNILLEVEHEHEEEGHGGDTDMYRTITQEELRAIQRKNRDPSSCGEGVIVHIFDNNNGTNTNISSAIDEHLEHLCMIYSTSCKFVRVNASSCSPTYLQRKLGITSSSSLPAVIAIRNGAIEAQLSDIIPNLHDTLTEQDLKDGHFLTEFITISGFNKSQSCNNRRSLMDSFRFASFTNRG